MTNFREFDLKDASTWLPRDFCGLDAREIAIEVYNPKFLKNNVEMNF